MMETVFHQLQEGIAVAAPDIPMTVHLGMKGSRKVLKKQGAWVAAGGNPVGPVVEFAEVLGLCYTVIRDPEGRWWRRKHHVIVTLSGLPGQLSDFNGAMIHHLSNCDC